MILLQIALYERCIKHVIMGQAFAYYEDNRDFITIIYGENLKYGNTSGIALTFLKSSHFLVFFFW